MNMKIDTATSIQETERNLNSRLSHNHLQIRRTSQNENECLESSHRRRVLSIQGQQMKFYCISLVKNDFDEMQLRH